MTNSINVSEVYYALLKEHAKEKADEVMNQFNFILMNVGYDLAIKAASFRHANKKAKFSYADCIGYIASIQNDLIFLTGDKEFAHFDNVEFVK